MEADSFVFPERGAGDGDEGINGEAFRGRRELGHLADESNAVFVRLAQADDPPRADRDAGLADVLNRLQALIVRPRRDHLRVKFSRRVQVVVVRR